MKKEMAEKMVRHPIRVKILALLANDTMSPVELSEKMGVTLGTTAYHVRTLHNGGVLKLVRKRSVRGAVEHFYTMRKPAKEDIKAALIKMTQDRSAAEEALTKF
jgi:predicted ArsR family transcriptional regulator